MIHIAQGDYPNSRNWLTNPASGVSSHFIIDFDGAISQMVSIFDSAWANGLWWDAPNRCWRAPRKTQTTAPIVTPRWPNILPGTNPNRYTISIEHAGKSGERAPATQIAATVKLLRWLADQFTIVWTVGRTLIRHADINPLDKPFCPGAGFDLAHIAAMAHEQPDAWAGWGSAFPLPADQRAWGIPQAWLADGGGLGEARSEETYLADGRVSVRVFQGGLVWWQRATDRCTIGRFVTRLP